MRSLLGLGQLRLQLQHLLLGYGQLYLDVMKPLALLLHLRLSAPKASLRTSLVPVRGDQLQSQLLIPPFGDGERLVGLCAKVIRKPRLVTGVLHQLLGSENLLGDQCKSNKNIP